MHTHERWMQGDAYLRQDSELIVVRAKRPQGLRLMAEAKAVTNSELLAALKTRQQ